MNDQPQSELLFKGSCDNCGSSDANAHYSDGHAYCFSCGHYTASEDGGVAPTPKETRISKDLLPTGEARALPKRGLTEETCRRWGYTVGRMAGDPVQIANYRDPATGAVVAQKVRTPDKDFKFLGDTKAAGLYGQHLWRSGRRVIITEGEIDALSVSQALDHKWPVVSVPNGAQGAAKSLSKQIEWLLGFDEIVLCFDNDQPGRDAVAECAPLFPPGRVFIAHLPEGTKDASDLVAGGRSAELVRRLWEAPQYRPDGLVTLADLRDAVLLEPTVGLDWWLPSLTTLTYGRRTGECVALGAGTGVGKSDFIAQQIAFDLQAGHSVGAFLLEQQPVESAKRIAGKVAGRRFHVPGDGWTPAELVSAMDVLGGGGRLYLYDNFGATDWEVIRDRIRFLARSEGVKLFYLDHLTALAAAEEDERVALERIMAELGGLVKELDVWLLFVSHLATPEGKPHEEGGRVTIRHFKGSRAIGYWSHFMFGLERDQQAEDESERGITTFRVLKDRYTGQATGQTITLNYDGKTGLLHEGGRTAEDHGF